MPRDADFEVYDKEAPRKAVVPQIVAAAEDLCDDTARHTPADTHNLRDGWKVRRDGLDAWVYNDVPYVRAVENGYLHVFWGHRPQPEVYHPPVGMFHAALARAEQKW